MVVKYLLGAWKAPTLLADGAGDTPYHLVATTRARATARSADILSLLYFATSTPPALSRLKNGAGQAALDVLQAAGMYDQLAKCPQTRLELLLLLAAPAPCSCSCCLPVLLLLLLAVTHRSIVG